MNVEEFDLAEKLDIPLPGEFDGLRVFAVGGVVRGLFTGEKKSDIDLMVQGSTPEEMLEAGFKLVLAGTPPDGTTNDEVHERAVKAAEEGRLEAVVDEMGMASFPVFIDSLGREVTLARTERSTGERHQNSDSVTVTEDLSRRDFTVNAMAVQLTSQGSFERGKLIDPFDGREDFNRKQIRMVSQRALNVDPIRILRMARFAARLGFEIELETLEAAASQVGNLSSIPTNRHVMELRKVFKQADKPSRFFRVLADIGALEIVLPELAKLQGVPAGPEEFHREGDAFEHTMCVIDEMASLRPGDVRAGFAALAHDIGKGETPGENLPGHPKHHIHGVEVVERVAERLSLSNEEEGVMKSACRFHMRMHTLDELRDSTLIRMVERLQSKSETPKHLRGDELISLAIADSRGREPAREFDTKMAETRFENARAAIEKVDGEDILEQFDPKDGEHIGELLLQERIKSIRRER